MKMNTYNINISIFAQYTIYLLPDLVHNNRELFVQKWEKLGV